MSNLYIFGIGGTGSRVLRALTMLLASGVECKAGKIIPIIIDPDDSAADMQRATSLMDNYRSVREHLNFSGTKMNRFFSTELASVDGMVNYHLPLENTRDCDFKGFIDLNKMTLPNQALMRILFSEKNLDSDMKVGFKGNPNIGSVVLNQFAVSKAYDDFANSFCEGDRIFIISSIFGGTGASGFPLLLKTLRTDRKSQKWNYISKAKIGAVTVLPYFDVSQDENSGVDSGTFVSKTKSALAYYDRNISSNGSIDALYYLGDVVHKTYDNHDGGKDQMNNAHFIELAAALAALYFADMDDADFAGGTVHFEYGLDTVKSKESKIDTIIFENLGGKSKELLNRPLTQFILMYKYLFNKAKGQYRHQPWAIDNGLDENFFSSDFYKKFTRVLEDYHDWLEEMDNNARSFKPFNENSIRPLFGLIDGVNPRKRGFLRTDYAAFDHVLNNAQHYGDSAASKEHKLMEIFYRATEELVEQKFNIR